MHPADRDLETDPGALEPGFDIGRQPIQRDRPLHQPPDDEAGDQNQHRGKRAEPHEAMMRAAPDPPHRRPAHIPPARECRQPRRNRAMGSLLDLSRPDAALPRPADPRLCELGFAAWETALAESAEPGHAGSARAWAETEA